MSDGKTSPLNGTYTGSMASSEAGTTTRSAGVDTLISPTSVSRLLLCPLATCCPLCLLTSDGLLQALTTSTTKTASASDVLLVFLQEQYEKNMQGLVGSLFDPSEEEDIPLLYFHSFFSFFKWVCSWAIPGLGMFSEAYFVFSIGNIKPILADQYPACWSKYQVSDHCNLYLFK